MFFFASSRLLDDAIFTSWCRQSCKVCIVGLLNGNKRYTFKPYCKQLVPYVSMYVCIMCVYVMSVCLSVCMYTCMVKWGRVYFRSWLFMWTATSDR